MERLGPAVERVTPNDWPQDELPLKRPPPSARVTCACGRTATFEAVKWVHPNEPGGDRSDDGDELHVDLWHCPCGQKHVIPTLVYQEKA